MDIEKQKTSTDLIGLSKLLKEEGIGHIFKEHPATSSKDLLGYSPAGDYQIKIGKLSIIRGYVSFGEYELFDGRDVERRTTAKGMLLLIKEKLN